MSEETNPIEALLQNDPGSFRDQVSDILMNKLSDRLELERLNTAADFFGLNQDEGESEDEPEETEDYVEGDGGEDE